MNLDKKIYDKNISEITSHVNIGSSEEISIKDLALIIKKVIGFKGEIKFDNAKPDGTLRKLLDSSLINKIGFQPKVSLVDGIKITYQEYIRQCKP
jgi:GDP-L-fucose synthase